MAGLSQSRCECCMHAGRLFELIDQAYVIYCESKNVLAKTDLRRLTACGLQNVHITNHMNGLHIIILLRLLISVSRAVGTMSPLLTYRQLRCVNCKRSSAQSVLAIRVVVKLGEDGGDLVQLVKPSMHDTLQILCDQ